MLAELFPRIHTRVASLRLLGPHMDGFVVWLQAKGYPALPIRLRVRELPRLEARLWRRGVRQLSGISAAQLRALAPKDSQRAPYRSAVVRSLAEYLVEQKLLGEPVPTASEEIVAAYAAHLGGTRGLADSTRTHHCATVAEFLKTIGYEHDRTVLRQLSTQHIEAFLRVLGARICREGVQHQVAHLRSFLRFLASRDLVTRGLEASIDTPRVYRNERLPRSLPWGIVKAFLGAIDRSTPMGRRDYAMFLLIATYGLRTSEVAALRLEHLHWRAGRICVPRPKSKTALVLPLTDEVGAALHAYLRHGRPALPAREVFLRIRAPAGPIAPTAITEAFQAWTRRGRLPIPFQGPHCLRHSLAVHLLRQGTPLKAIGDLLGHRGAESTCIYLRLNIEDLRDAALNLPSEAP